MRSILPAFALVMISIAAQSAELVTRGGELVCFKREDLRAFAGMLRERGLSAVQSKPGCIAALPGLIFQARGSAGQIEGVGQITKVRALSYTEKAYFDGFTTARF